MASSVFLYPGTLTVAGNLIVTGVVNTADGTAAAPAQSYILDPDTGQYRIGANNEGFSAGGVLRFDYNTTRILSTIPLILPSGSVGAPALGIGAATTGLASLGGNTFSAVNNGSATTGFVGSGVQVLNGLNIGWASDVSGGTASNTILTRDGADNTLALKNGTNAQTFRNYGYASGARSTYQSIMCVTTAVTLSGATSGTGNVIPAGATVLDVATSTTTTITNASGYTVGDGSDADRYGDKTGTAVGTNTGSTDYTADPRWWTNAARAITLTAKTANFTGGVVQVSVFFTSATGA